MATIAEVISRLRGQMKAEVQDAFVTDRFIYSLINKFAQVLMRRQDSANKLNKFNSIWEVLPYVELIDVDKVEAGCAGIFSGCTIKRSKHKLPKMIEGYWGNLIRNITSIDSSVGLQPTYPSTYVSISRTTGFKYNQTKYYWFLNGYIYCPNLEWDGIRIEGVFDSDLSDWTCYGYECVPRYEQHLNIPEAMMAEIEQNVLNIMLNTIKIPADDIDDKININR